MVPDENGNDQQNPRKRLKRGKSRNPFSSFRNQVYHVGRLYQVASTLLENFEKTLNQGLLESAVRDYGEHYGISNPTIPKLYTVSYIQFH